MQFWDDAAVRPWQQDDKFSLDKADFNVRPVPADMDVHAHLRIDQALPDPVFRWEVDPTRVSLRAGDWCAVEVKFMLMRDDDFRLAYGNESDWSLRLDATDVLDRVAKTIGAVTVNPAVAFGFAAVAGRIRKNLVGKKIVISLHTNWKPGTGTASGLECALLLTLRSFTGWLVPTPNPWYVSLTRAGVVSRPVHRPTEEEFSGWVNLDISEAGGMV